MSYNREDDMNYYHLQSIAWNKISKPKCEDVWALEKRMIDAAYLVNQS